MKKYTFALLSCLVVVSVGQTTPVRLEGQLGGTSDAIAVYPDGMVTYLAVGPRIVILELSQPDDMQEIGRSEVLPQIVQDIVVEGTYAFAAAGRAGLYILDVSDAAAPKIVGRHSGPSEPAFNRGRRVHLSGKHAYFADGEAGLRIIDVSNPASPHVKEDPESTPENTFRRHRCAQDPISKPRNTVRCLLSERGKHTSGSGVT